MGPLHGHRNCLTVDGVEYDVSNLFTTSTKPSEPNKSVADMKRRRNENRPSQQLSRTEREKQKQMMDKDSIRSPEATRRRISCIRVENKKYGLKTPPDYSKEKIPKEQLLVGDKRTPPPPPPPEKLLVEPKSPQPEEDSDDSGTPLVEIEPGVNVHLRGSKETARAIRLGLVTYAKCLCCNQDISFIHDAAFFICPTCRVVGHNPDGVWGVGLGFITYST